MSVMTATASTGPDASTNWLIVQPLPLPVSICHQSPASFLPTTV
jgi:hypothetical protein